MAAAPAPPKPSGRAWLRWSVTAVLLAGLIGAGYGQRQFSALVDATAAIYHPPAQPFATVPLSLGPWEGREIEIEERIRRQPGFDDDWISRQYIQAETGRSANLFAGYIGRGFKWLVHRPDICFPGAGWRVAREEFRTLTPPAGRPVPYVLYEFELLADPEQRIFVLSTFVVNGQLSNNVNLRNSRLFSERPPYIARIQVSLGAGLEHERDRELLRDLVVRIVAALEPVLPYWEE